MKIIDIVRGLNKPAEPKKIINPIGNYVAGAQCLYNISQPNERKR